MNLAEFGNTINRIRIKRGLTLMELAAMVDISYPSLCQITRGYSHPKAKTLIKLSTALDHDFTKEYTKVYDSDGLFALVNLLQDIEKCFDENDFIEFQDHYQVLKSWKSIWTSLEYTLYTPIMYNTMMPAMKV
ncbi:MAG: helix-turn-helix transcriptional regulator [Tissierellia bacterium]|nr:helix-turn-helix transcriptional regulator [Tissierellia bacterium]